MGKGNKVRKREVKKPKQDKKQKAVTAGATVTRAVNTTPPASPRPASAVPPPAGR